MLKSFYKWLIGRRSSSLKFDLPSNDELAYSEWEFEEGRRAWFRFFAGRADLRGKKVIDLGCGHGGKTAFYAFLGVERACGIDVVDENIVKAEKYARKKKIEEFLEFKRADAAATGVKDSSFDIAISDDSFEHYSDPQGILREAGRIVKTEGLFLIDFSQWRSPSGHHLEPWLDVSWAHLVFSTEEIHALAREVGEKYITSVEGDSQKEIYKKKLDWSLTHYSEFLNRISIAEFEKLVTESGVWSIKHSRHTAASPWLFPFKFIPGLREYTVGRNIYILERK